MKNVLSRSRARLLEMRPLVGIPSRGSLRNTTSFLWKRRFSSNMGIYQKLKSTPNKRSTGTKHAQNIVNHVTQNDTQISLKWAILTGVTLVIGTIIYTSRHNVTNTLNDKEFAESKDGVTNNNRKKDIKISNNNWFFFCYSTLPLNAVSRLWGQFNNLTLPMWFRPIGYKFYSYLFDVNLDEIEDPDLYHYANLGEFFYRRIKPESRPIAPGEDVVVSPSDGEVLQLGIINSETGEIQQVKGLTYSIKEFLGTHGHSLVLESEPNLNPLTNESQHEKFAKKNKLDLFSNVINNKIRTDVDDTVTREDGNVMNVESASDGESLQELDFSNSKTLKLVSELSTNIPYYYFHSNTEPKNTELYFAVIYLSPGDYHHYHSPVDWVCKKRRHFPGDLFSVSPYFQRNFPNLFVLNERVALLGYWKYGFFSMTPVGATNVGSIKLSFDQELVTNVKRKRNLDPHICYEVTYSNASRILGGIPLIKGEEMGGFELGSTVVLCFEAPKNFKFNVNAGDKIKMGEKLGSLT